MPKTKVVVFEENTARILINPVKIPKGGLIDPDLTAVVGLPPHLWCLDGDKIIPRTEVHKSNVLNKRRRFVREKLPVALGFITGFLSAILIICLK